ncbi:MAG: hypothetical protein RJA36_3616 [Pseudomonadota bacterium]|jgi:chorismate--pyruvate lyase
MDGWLASPQLGRLTSSPEARSWLAERGSLTLRLRRHYPDLEVRVLCEGPGHLLPDEAHRLGLEPGSPAWVREVILHAHGLELVEARSAIPYWSPDNPWCAVQRLGSRALGELLFSDPELERSDFEFMLGAGWRWHGSAPAEPRLARRCLYHRRAAPLLLTERFLQIAA